MKSTHSETCKGTGIAITTTQSQDGWAAHATYTISGQAEVRLCGGTELRVNVIVLAFAVVIAAGLAG